MHLSSQNRTRRNKYITITFVLLLVLILTSISLSGCTYKTYTGNIGDAKFSFQYRKNGCVNPPEPYSTVGDPPDGLQIPEGCSVYPDSHIIIDVYERRGLAIDAWISLDLILASLRNNKYLNDLEITEQGTVIIAGMTAEYATYYYTGYTTVPVYYWGKAASFVYGDYIVDIDVLFIARGSDTDTAFDLIVDTFTIKE